MSGLAVQRRVSRAEKQHIHRDIPGSGSLPAAANNLPPSLPIPNDTKNITTSGAARRLIIEKNASQSFPEDLGGGGASSIARDLRRTGQGLRQSVPSYPLETATLQPAGNRRRERVNLEYTLRLELSQGKHKKRSPQALTPTVRLERQRPQ